MDNAIETILLTEAHITGTRLSLFPNFVETQTRDAAGCTARNWEFLAEIVTRPTRAMHAGISQPRHVRVLGEPSWSRGLYCRHTGRKPVRSDYGWSVSGELCNWGVQERVELSTKAKCIIHWRSLSGRTAASLAQTERENHIEPHFVTSRRCRKCRKCRTWQDRLPDIQQLRQCLDKRSGRIIVNSEYAMPVHAQKPSRY